MEVSSSKPVLATNHHFHLLQCSSASNAHTVRAESLMALLSLEVCTRWLIIGDARCVCFVTCVSLWHSKCVYVLEDVPSDCAGVPLCSTCSMSFRENQRWWTPNTDEQKRDRQSWYQYSTVTWHYTVTQKSSSGFSYLYSIIKIAKNNSDASQTFYCKTCCKERLVCGRGCRTHNQSFLMLFKPNSSKSRTGFVWVGEYTPIPPDLPSPLCCIRNYLWKRQDSQRETLLDWWLM